MRSGFDPGTYNNPYSWIVSPFVGCKRQAPGNRKCPGDTMFGVEDMGSHMA